MVSWGPNDGHTVANHAGADCVAKLDDSTTGESCASEGVLIDIQRRALAKEARDFE